MSTRSHRHLALALGIALLLGSWLAAFAFTLWRLREDAVDRGIDMAATHARNFEEHFTQTLQVIDLTAGSIDPLSEGRINPTELGRRLMVALRPAPFLRSISLLDANGRIIASSNPDNLGVRVAVSGFFPAAGPDVDVLRIGLPWRGRDFAAGGSASPGAGLDASEAAFVPVLRRLPAGEGFWLLAAINPDYFINHAAHLLTTADSHVQWLRYDDVLLFSSSPKERPGSRAAAGRVAANLPLREHGAFAQRLGEGPEVLTAYRASSRFPAVAAVHVSRDSALAAWRTEARRLASIVLPVLAALTIAGLLVWRRQQRIERQQEELDRQRRLAASVFDASTEAILMTTPDAEIISVNAAFERITGYAAAEVMGRNPRLLSSGLQDSEFYRRMWDTLLASGNWQGEIVNRRKDGSLYTGLVNISSVTDEHGRLLHYVGVSTDITERKRYEATLLEEKERSEAAALAKTTFLATMSHEIRTPMNGIVGITDLMLMSEASPRQREYLEVIKSSADSLLTILDEILDFSKIEAQGVSIEAVPFDLIEVVNDVVSLFAARAQAKGLVLAQEIAPGLPGHVVGDPTRLRQILSNLISNAVKFTQEGRILVRAEPASADGRLRFAVTDTGVGIVPEHLELIFDSFRQADGSTTRRYGGTGLGLAISRRIAEAMGGTLTVSSEPGKGSCFTLEVTVRIDRAGDVMAAAGKPEISAGHRHISGLEILLAEDSAVNQMVLQSMLTKLGHRVEVVGDGLAAVAAVTSRAYDVVLMDVRMPELDGIEATRRIRAAEPAGTRLPIVALTANAYASDRAACIDAGMDDFLSKPVGLAQLRGALERIATSREGATAGG